MSFKASKIRAIRPSPNGEGKPIAPNAGLPRWYTNEINPYVTAMIDDYKSRLIGELNSADTVRFRVADGSVSDSFNYILKSLQRKWGRVFNGLSKDIGEKFVGKIKSAADATVDYSLSVAGIKAPRSTYTDNIRNTVDGYTHFNETLITEIQSKAHSQIYNAVMASVTSTNPEEQGQSGIIAALKKVGIETKERTLLIARDQTSKLYGALAVDRMRENKVEYFRWMHVMESNAKGRGKIQWRVSHEALDGEVFSVNDPELWMVGKYFAKKGDIGIPGHAINCHCRMIPIVIPTAADLDSIERRYGKKARDDFEMAA